jgi:acetyltransferase-like isoleucine patch superfamily enzyme
MDFSIGQFCVIQDPVEIGEGTRVGNFVFIRSHTRIGKACVIGSYVDIEGEVEIGSQVSLQSNCYLTRGVVIEDQVFCGPRLVTMNDRKICHLRPTLVFVRAAPKIRRAARIGGGVTLAPGITIGENAFVRAVSVVLKDVPDATIVGGNPARVLGCVPAEQLM